MRSYGRITRERLNKAVGVVIRRIDQQKTNPLEALLRLEGRTFRVGEGDTLTFKKKVERTDKNEDDPFPRIESVTYVVPEISTPILRAEVMIYGYLPYESRISLLCSEQILGYSVEDEDEFGNRIQYRFFSNDVDKTNSSFRRQLVVLSKKLSS